ncbi:MAG: hypothetical protein ACRERE_20085 [Candidatus Entotheonellia bacterium]
MALQTQDLIMVGLSVRGDRPPIRLQPPLVDGIHLRWSCRRGFGFPWYGFYLFRRHRLLGDPICLSRETLNLSVTSRLDVQLNTPVGRVSSDVILRLTNDFPTTPAGGQVEFDLDGRQYLRFTLPPGELARRVEVRIGFRQAGAIHVTALSGDTPFWREAEVPVSRSRVEGRARDVISTLIEFDAITAIELSAGPAALVDLCYVPVSQEATRDWAPVPNFPNPMALPLTQPDYPCTQGQPEDLTRARTTARRRIRYDDPNRFTSSAAPTPTTGTVAVANGSAIVEGAGTRWRPDLAGQLFQVTGDPTAYTILVVVNGDKLVLSRGYNGATQNRVAYTIRPDAFGQLHDYLVHLVAGGSAARPMAQRLVPAPIYDTGTIAVNRNASVVSGTGTNWDRRLTGLGLQIIGDTTGTVTVYENSDRVTGVGTNWSADMAGLAFRTADAGRVYTIMRVDVPAQQLELDRGYLDPPGAGKTYAIFDQTVYTIASVDSPTQIALDRHYMGHAGAGKSYAVVTRLQPASPAGMAPHMPRQHPLDLILTMALHPAIAQMVGLYWVDQTADPNIAYDYLIVADHTGVGGLDPNTVLARLGQNGFTQLDGYILFNRQVASAAALEAPGGMQAHALPAVSLSDSAMPEAQNMVGLSWDLGVTEQGVLLPGEPVLYHVWRDYLGNDAAPAAQGPRTLVTQDGPLLVTVPGLRPGEAPQRPPDWPTSPLHFIDSRLPDGWYDYRVSGIDIFGRYSPESAQDTVRLLDDTPPPPPTGIEAFALDPDDPTVLRDDAYNTWRAANPGVVGLRVRWLWTHMHIRQAPDVREFRIYYQPGRMNALVGRTLSVSAASTTESTVETDIPNTQGANAYVGVWLRIGPDAFRIVASEAANPLRLRVRNSGPTDNIQPRVNAPCTVVIPPPYTAGNVALVNGFPTVTGSGTGWQAEFAGRRLQVAEDPDTYTVVQVNGPNQLVLDRGYDNPTAAAKAYTLMHPLFTDETQPTNWAQRYHVVGYDQQVIEQVPAVRAPDGSALSGAAATASGTLMVLGDNPDLSGVGLVGEFLYLANDSQRADRTYLIRAVDNTAKTVTVDDAPDLGNVPSPWVIGRPVRRYEVFLPAPGDFVPALAEPIMYARIGVSAADDKDYAADDLVWADADRGGWGDRTGNEGRVGSTAQIFRVQRTPPPTPEVPVYLTDRVYATPADYHRHSYYTYRWQPLVDQQTQAVLPVRCHIFRALDDAVFKRDWLIRATRAALDPTNPGHERNFPASWTQARKQAAASQLNAIASMADYATLSSDAQEVLGRLPGNEGTTWDNGLQQRDWAVRASRDRLVTSDTQYFPVEWRADNAENNQRRQDIADALNQLNSLSRDPAAAHYRNLLEGALRVLAGLPGNERAFTQLTIQPLDPQERDPEDPALLRWRNRRGPDDPDNFQVPDPNNPLASETLRVYIDTLDGRSTNRYFYRAAFVDGAHNRSMQLSLVSPPVHLPDVVPPRTPVITRLLAGDADPIAPGDGKITLYWASNREADLAEYRVYRTSDVRQARDIRLMDLVHTEAAGNPANRPAEQVWTDNNVRALVTYTYRLVAVDTAGNVSIPSAPGAARAYDTRLPEPPQLALAWVDQGGTVRAEVTWTSTHEVLIQRRRPGGPWFDIPDRKPAGTYIVRDQASDPSRDYEYRALVRSTTGAIKRGAPQILAAASP